MHLVLFYFFAGIAVVASLLVIAQRNTMYSVLLLIASFGALAGLYVLLEAPFIAVTQIIIYAGAIMVVFLFVVMLLNVGVEEGPNGDPKGARGFGVILAVALGLELVWALNSARGPLVPLVVDRGRAVPDASSVREIGRALFTEYAFAFEVTSILILVAMLGAIVLARREA